MRHLGAAWEMADVRPGEGSRHGEQRLPVWECLTRR